MKLPSDTVIAREKITDYLLVRQARNDKSAFLEGGGYTPVNPDALLADLTALRTQLDATLVDDNQFGCYYEIIGTLRRAGGQGLRVRTIWMREHLSGVTKFVTLIPIEIIRP